MPSLSVARAFNETFKPAYLPVAIFVGGTSGIGQGMAEAFAMHTKGNAHIIICGRNRAGAEASIASFPRPTIASSGTQPLHEFVHCDVTLMKNVKATTTELLSRLPKVNFLVLTPGFLTLKGRDETEEGIDKKLALHYYGRWKFVYDLMPLLEAAKEKGEDAKVLSVMAAGKGGPIDMSDLGLKKNYTLSNAAKAAPTYNDLMIEEFAARHPDLAFTHSFPGLVRTALTKFDHWSLKPLNPVFQGLMVPFSRSQAECAELMWFGLLNGDKGAFRRNERGDDIGRRAYYGSEEARKTLWEHTLEITGS